MLRSELVTQENFEEAVKLQNEIFPRENARAFLLKAVSDISDHKTPEKYKLTYYLVRDKNNKAVGIWGHYIVDSKNELWLGWYGVHPQERLKGYGTEICEFFESYAKLNGFCVLRLYTDEVDNAAACKLYEKMGMVKEYYENPNDMTKDVGRIVIYSKALTREKLMPWNNKFINYKGQNEKLIKRG